MEAITIDKLIERLKKFENEYIVVVLEGNIEERIDMELSDAKKDEDFIEIIYNKNKREVLGKSLKINLHQIKNIETNEDKEFYIYLDGEQKVIIFTNIEVLENYNLLKFNNKNSWKNKASEWIDALL